MRRFIDIVEGSSDDFIDQTCREIKALVPETLEIWFHGSRARGDHRPSSDWDFVAVVADETTNETLWEYAKAAGPLAPLWRRRIDVQVRRNSDKKVRGSVLWWAVEEGRKVFGDSSILEETQMTKRVSTPPELESFVMSKWVERAKERYDPVPADLSAACKFSALFAQAILGGEIKANELHTWVEVGGEIVDLTSNSKEVSNLQNGDVGHYGRAYGISVPETGLYTADKKFMASRDFKASLNSCKPRVKEWVKEYRLNEK